MDGKMDDGMDGWRWLTMTGREAVWLSLLFFVCFVPHTEKTELLSTNQNGEGEAIYLPVVVRRRRHHTIRTGREGTAKIGDQLKQRNDTRTAAQKKPKKTYHIDSGGWVSFRQVRPSTFPSVCPSVCCLNRRNQTKYFTVSWSSTLKYNKTKAPPTYC